MVQRQGHLRIPPVLQGRTSKRAGERNAALIDLYAPAAPGTMLRSARIRRKGLYRLSRRECVLVGTLVLAPESGVSVVIADGDGKEFFDMPNMFTGSFYLGAGCDHGLLVSVHSAHDSDSINLTLTYREIDGTKH